MPISRRDFLGCAAGLAAAGLAAPRLLAQPRFASDPYTLGVASGYPDAGRRRAVDAAGARAARRRRHAARPRSKSAGKSRPTRPSASIVRRGTEIAAPRMGALGARRSRRARAGALVLLPLPRRRRSEPGRPHPHRARRQAPAAERLRFAFALLPAVRAGLLRRLPPHGGRGPRPRRPPRRLHLRVLVGTQPRAQARAPANRSRSTSTATATRSTRATPTCRPPRRLSLARHLGRPRGAERLRQRPLAGRAIRREAFLARRAAAYQAYYEHMPLPAAHAAARAGHADLHAAASSARSRASTCSTTASTARTRCARAPAAAAATSSPRRNARSCCDPARTLLGAEQEHWLTTASRAPARAGT